jgi:cell division protein FtsB
MSDLTVGRVDLAEMVDRAAQAFEVLMAERAKDRRIAELEAEVAAKDEEIERLKDCLGCASESLTAWDNIEAEFCPEGVGLAEYIASLTRRRHGVLAYEINPSDPPSGYEIGSGMPHGAGGPTFSVDAAMERKA